MRKGEKKWEWAGGVAVAWLYLLAFLRWLRHFFPFWPFLNHYSINESVKFGPFKSHQSVWCDLWRSRVNLTGATSGTDAWTVANVAPCGLGRLSHVTAENVTGSQISVTSSYWKPAPASSSSLSLFLSLTHGRPPPPPTSLMSSAFLHHLRPSNSGPQPLPR
jgi:hypothetical protein